MNHEPPAWIHRALSLARFDRYLKVCGGDTAVALRLYWWNIEISSAFYGPLHCLEVALRNALHDRLCRAHGRLDWWRTTSLDADGHRRIDQAKAEVRRRGIVAPGADDVVAELTFGFWVSLLSRRYDRRLWVPVLHEAFPRYRGRRDDLHRALNTMRLFRNRVMHYEPVHDRPLSDRHATLYRMLGYLGPSFAMEARRMDRVPQVLARRADVCAGNLEAKF
jgi:hypothetical protein